MDREVLGARTYLDIVRTSLVGYAVKSKSVVVGDLKRELFLACCIEAPQLA